jgi:hypothetical protein
MKQANARSVGVFVLKQRTAATAAISVLETVAPTVSKMETVARIFNFPSFHKY